MPSSQHDFALSLPARATSLAVVRHVLSGVLDVWPVDRALLDDVQIAVAEACSNVVTHAYRDQPAGRLEVHGGVSDGHVVVSVRDHGSGFAPRTDSPGLGLGFPLIGALTESLQVGTVDDGSNEVRMTFPLEPR